MPVFDEEPTYIVRENKKDRTFEVLTMSTRDFGWHPADLTLPLPMHNPHHAKSHFRRFIRGPRREPDAKYMTAERRKFLASIGNPPPASIRPISVSDLLAKYPEHEARLAHALNRYHAKRARVTKTRQHL